MAIHPFFSCIFFLFGCSNSSSPGNENLKADSLIEPHIESSLSFDEKSWPYFLQHLPVVNHAILDYTGKPINYQDKHVAIVQYDVGKSDLQQCADVLMRLRAEYLYKQQRGAEIGFHFVSGQYYSWNDYCKGLRPVPKGNNVYFITRAICSKTRESLRKYLDIVYTYASTISLAKELKKANHFEIGSVIIHPGNPGHCFIIVDEATGAEGEKVFKLVEGYTPAQSIYVLRNIWEKGMNPWYKLKRGVIKTASYEFTNYEIGTFE
jgi:hypothetical protein